MQTLALLLIVAGTPAVPVPVARASAALSQPESVDELIARGRELLRAKKLDLAQQAFTQAAELDKSTPRTRVWLARVAIARGELENALQMADELKAAKAPAGDVDYLFGLCFFGQAVQSLAEGGGQYTQGQFDDATANLERALGLDAARYADAWLPLAEAAWYAQNLPVARKAAERAVALDGNDPAAHMALGRVAFSEYSAAQGAGDAAKADALWSAALSAFAAAIDKLGAPRNADEIAQLADAHVQTAYLHQWKQDLKQAAASYALAAGLNPARVDFNQMRTALGAEFEACAADALARFEKRYGQRDAASATLRWWYGYALFDNGKMPEAETHFRRAVELWPSFTNSWYYVYRTAYSQQKYEAALEALETHWKLDADALVAALGAQRELDLPIVEYLVGWCADPSKHADTALNDKAALLSEMLTRVAPDEPRYWNNLGLFLRDQGDQMRWLDRDIDPAVLQPLWEAAHAAYAKTLELEPDNPNYLNDTAVMLHYYLKRDYAAALSMYEKAAKCAEEKLARKDLRPDEREATLIAKRDSNNNIPKVKRLMDKLARGEKPGPEDEDQ